VNNFIFLDDGRTLGFIRRTPGRIGRVRADRQRGWWWLHWHHIWLPAARARRIADLWEY
jgi:hypothetical protein